MRKLSEFYAIALLVFVLVLCMEDTASAEASGTWKNLTWNLDNDGILTISGNGTMASFGYPSTDAWRADLDSISEIVIEEGVTSIANFAFSDCRNLTSVIIPDGVISIGSAFSGCSSLTSIDLPDSVTSIGQAVFYNCSSLTSIAIPEGVTSIGNSAFRDCISLIGVTIPNSVTSIGGASFSGCYNLTSITIPNSVTRIEFSAFFGCSGLTSITIPDSVTSIGSNAFSGCSRLTSVTIPDRLSTISDYLFYGCSSLTNITIPDSVTSIGYSAFCGCSSLTSVLIPDSVTSIDGSAFSQCSSLTSITIPDSVLSIGDYAFLECSKLKNITIPNRITSISYGVFQNCNSLTSVTIPNNVTKIGSAAFRDCSCLTCITLPDNLISIGNNTFYNCSSLTSIDIPDCVVSIGDYAFCNCKKLTFVRIPNGMTSIADSVFSGCTSLARVVIPDSVTSIGSLAFSSCSGLTSITLPDNLISIGDGAFRSCSALKSLTIPISITRIESATFAFCSSLSAISIPESVVYIGDDAFVSCANLESILFAGVTTSFGSNVLPNIWFTTVYCYEYSDADGWATENGFEIVYLDDLNLDTIRMIELSGDSRMAQGSTECLSVSVFPMHDNPVIIWTSSDPDVVFVKDGIVTANSLGRATVTVTVGAVSQSINITVYAEAEGFTLNEQEIWVIAKESVQLYVQDIEPIGADVELMWQSSDISLATVNEEGLVTTKKPGDVTITATTARGIARECLIHLCYPVTAIEFEPTALSLAVGRTTQLAANVTMRTQTCVNHLVTFTSSDPSIATVDENGLVSAHAFGTVTITAAAASGATAECAVTVRDANRLILPAGTERIESEAFADLPNVDIIVISDDVTFIADDAFTGSGQITIEAPAGSYAVAWAQDNGFDCITD